VREDAFKVLCAIVECIQDQQFRINAALPEGRVRVHRRRDELRHERNPVPPEAAAPAPRPLDH
jgi:hypothetical protein